MFQSITLTLTESAVWRSPWNRRTGGTTVPCSTMLSFSHTPFQNALNALYMRYVQTNIMRVQFFFVFAFVFALHNSTIVNGRQSALQFLFIELFSFFSLDLGRCLTADSQCITSSSYTLDNGWHVFGALQLSESQTVVYWTSPMVQLWLARNCTSWHNSYKSPCRGIQWMAQIGILPGRNQEMRALGQILQHQHLCASWRSNQSTVRPNPLDRLESELFGYEQLSPLLESHIQSTCWWRSECAPHLLGPWSLALAEGLRASRSSRSSRQSYRHCWRYRT